MRRRFGSALAGLVLLAGVAGEARAAGTVQITGGFTRAEADTSIHCTQQEGDFDNEVLTAGPEDFEAEVSAASSGADLEESCGVRATAYAEQETSVSADGAGLVVTSSGAGGGAGTGEPTDDGDFEIERFDGESVVSVGFEVTGGPVEFSLSGGHSGRFATGAFSDAVVSDPRTGQTLPEGFSLTGILQPGSYNIKGAAECTHLPPGGTNVCPEAGYSFTLVVGEGAADADGDALPDLWEEDGVDADGDGTIDLDLPAMGADPLHKDLFLEIDHMQGHALLQSAVDVVTQAFADAPVANPDGTTGIALHVDHGPASPMSPGRTWGGLSDRDELTHVDVLGGETGGEYDWSEFDALKATSFAAEREPVFHYVISGHGYGSPTETSSGISRGIEGSDLLVTLGVGCAGTGADCTHTQPEQAGTLMHELGHNLGLRHGGGDGMNYKPNYLSIMNYAFQFVGLQSRTEPPRFDYSRFAIALDERALSENAGFGVTAGGAAAHMITFGFCPGPSRAVQPERRPDVAWNVLFSSDFDCDTAFASPVTSDVNADGAITALAPFEDWSNLVYDGGLVGLGDTALPDRTEMIEPQTSELLAAREAIGALSPPAVALIPAATATPTATAAPTATPTATPAPGPASPSGPALRPPPVLAGLSVRGTRVAYRLSESGRVRFRVERMLPGRRRGGRCVPPRRAPRGRRCTRLVKVRGSFQHAGRAGTNSLRLPRRVGGRALRPGRYVLVATPLAADGRAGRPGQVRFRIRR